MIVCFLCGDLRTFMGLDVYKDETSYGTQGSYILLWAEQ